MHIKKFEESLLKWQVLLLNIIFLDDRQVQPSPQNSTPLNPGGTLILTITDHYLQPYLFTK